MSPISLTAQRSDEGFVIRKKGTHQSGVPGLEWHEKVPLTLSSETKPKIWKQAPDAACHVSLTPFRWSWTRGAWLGEASLTWRQFGARQIPCLSNIRLSVETRKVSSWSRAWDVIPAVNALWGVLTTETTNWKKPFFQLGISVRCFSGHWKAMPQVYLIQNNYCLCSYVPGRQKQGARGI